MEKLSGEKVTVAELLEYVRRVVAEFALERILTPSSVMMAPLSSAGEEESGARTYSPLPVGEGPGVRTYSPLPPGEGPGVRAVDPLTHFYLLWRWTYNHARVHFDEARKLATGLGVELTQHWGPGGLVLKDKEYVRVRTPQERARDASFERRERFDTMIDALHRAAALWEGNHLKELDEHLAMTYGNNEAFWQVAQAISDVLPEGDKEKQILQGLLYGRKRYQDQVQKRLF